MCSAPAVEVVTFPLRLVLAAQAGLRVDGRIAVQCAADRTPARPADEGEACRNDSRSWKIEKQRSDTPATPIRAPNKKSLSRSAHSPMFFERKAVLFRSLFQVAYRNPVANEIDSHDEKGADRRREASEMARR